MTNSLRIGVTRSFRAEIIYQVALGLGKRDLPAGFQIITTYGVRDDRMGGLLGPLLLDRREQDLVILNPSPISYMALKGLGPFDHEIDIRNVGVFPSWDKLGFAVRREMGITSLRDIADRKMPLRASVRFQGPSGATMFAINKVLGYYGFTPKSIEEWGGRLEWSDNPSDPARALGLERGAYDAVFDEGLGSWADAALTKGGMTFLPLEEGAFAMMQRLGFRRSSIPRSRFGALDGDVPAVEFGGWPLCCRADMPEDIAYNVAAAIDDRRSSIPVESGSSLDVGKLCRDTEEGPMCIPLHPGAEKYYREHGYL